MQFRLLFRASLAGALCAIATCALAQDGGKRRVRSQPLELRAIIQDEEAPVAQPVGARQRSAKQRTAEIPLPRPRPPEAGPGNAAVVPADAAESAANSEPSSPPPPPTPSECFIALTKELADAEFLPPITGANGCEAPDVLKLHAVILSDNKTRISINPPATLRCPMATEIAHWVREDLVAATAAMGTLTGIDNYDSFECRGRNRIVGAKLSEHGKANALDVRALLLANKQRVTLTDPLVSHEFREKIRAQVCARFHTVLGPGSDGYHEEHIHLDLAERRNDYRICQWNVLDVPLPLPRPPEADIAQAEAEKKAFDEAAAAKKP